MFLIDSMAEFTHFESNVEDKSKEDEHDFVEISSVVSDS